MKIYVAGPMRGIPEFNFPVFGQVTQSLRALGHEVFSPAEKDIERHDGVDIAAGNSTGDVELAAQEHGFCLRTALAEDMDYICRHADAVVLLPGWRNSKGAIAEAGTAAALGLKLFEVDPDGLARLVSHAWGA